MAENTPDPKAVVRAEIMAALRRVIANAKSDTARVAAIIQLAKIEGVAEPESAATRAPDKITIRYVTPGITDLDGN